MKNIGTFLLICGLTSTVWGQSAPKNQKSVVLKCVQLSCSSSPARPDNRVVRVGSFYSFPAVPWSSANREVKMGTFAARAISSRPALLQVSKVERKQKMELAVAKTGAFPVASIVARR